ncbi:MAG: major royal jelly-related protein [Myxococcaceae bacterium]|nr:major royal jelly-related protein [Myxococcaceae bacterium]
MSARILAALASFALLGCAHAPAPAPGETAVALEEVAAVETQLTGVAVSQASGRVFINFPRWVDVPHPSVAEVWADKRVLPFPNEEWNAWDGTPQTAGDHFVCVQAVFVDGKDQLWIVDPASPGFAGVVPGGAKLLQVDLASGKVVRVYPLDATAAPQQSYLNDVRIDLPRRRAYLTDSGLGGILVLDLASGTARRRLEGTTAVKAEPGLTVTVEGKPWVGEDGKSPAIGSDGLALDAEGKYLYFHALTGQTLYRVPAASLADDSLTDEALAAKVEKAGASAPADGLAEDARGNLFLTDLTHGAVRMRRPDGTVTTVVQDPKLSWPDSLAFDSNGRLYITASQIHRMPAFNGGVDQRVRPFRLWRTTRALLPR